MKKLIFLFCTLMSAFASNAQSVATLNNYLSTYAQGIKVSNPLDPKSTSCIHKTGYVNAQLQGKYLIISFGFGYDWDKKGGYIDKDVITIDLSTASFYTGYWHKTWGKWEHYGDKKILTIEDNNGMDVTITDVSGVNNSGTRKTLVSKLRFDFGSEPIANRIINEIYTIQEKYKAKEEWLLPEPEPQKQIEEPRQSSSNNTTQKANSGKTNTSPDTQNTTTKKIGKYVQ